MTSQASFWDNMAVRYSKSPIRDMEAYNASLDRTRSYLKPTDTALELGCGTGGTARILAPHLAHITATDISSEMIRIARERAAEEGTQNAKFEVADLETSLPKGGPYDVVMAHNLIHLLPDPTAAMQEVANLVKPGGLFISKTPCLAKAELGWKWRLMVMAIPLMQLLGKAPHVTSFSITELEQMILDAGFTIVETGSYPVTPPGRYIVARRD